MALLPTPRRITGNSNGLQNRISNAQTRLNAVGMGNHDSRKGWEKALNLPEGQNVFFDIVDILQRPMQAGLNAASAALTSKDTRNPLSAAMQGLKGNAKVGGTELLTDLGLDPTRADTKLLGLGVEIAGDPFTYIPGGAIASRAGKVGRAVGKKVPQPVKNIVDEKVKQPLENAFSVEAPLRRTLTGAADDSLVELRRQGINDERYYTSRILEDIESAVKAAGGDLSKGVDVGRVLEKNLKVTDEVGNPIDIVRNVQTSPEVRRAASTIMNSNAEIRALADEAGITINDLEGYMAHVLTKEAREAMLRPVSSGRRGIGGRQDVIGERKLQGTAEEVNARMREERGYDFDMFEPNAFFATAHGQRRVLQYILAERAKREVLSNPNFAEPVMQGRRVRLGKNEVLINVDDYKFFKSETDELTGEVTKGGGQYIITKGAKQVLDAYKEKLSDDGIRGFMNFYGKAHNIWKKLALFSTGFHVRNDIGAKFNVWVAGMPIHQIPKYMVKDPIQDVSTARKAIEKNALGETLTEAEEQAFKMYDDFRREGLSESGIFTNEFRTDPEKAITRRVNRAGQSASRRALGNVAKPFETSQRIGVSIDELNRYGYFKYLVEKQGLHTDQAAEKVREALFDYGDITALERGAKHVFPFYTWMRKNIPFQLKNLATQPGKYSNLDKAIDTMYDLTDLNAEEDVPEWLRDALAVPVQLPGQENPSALNLRPPAADLAEILEDPVKTTVGAVSPLLKMPFEYATNTNAFTGRDIQEFPGQTKEFLGMDLPAGLHHAVSQLGAVRNLGANMNRVQNNNMEEFFSGGLLRNIDKDKERQNKLYEELQRLEGLINLYEQQTGSRPPTIRDLQN